MAEGQPYREVASNLDGDYKDKTCCIVGLRGSLVREEPLVARAITQALLDAAMFSAQNPDQAAASFQPYAPKAASLEDLQAMVRYHTHRHHPVGAVLKRELKAYADDLKLVSVFKPWTDTTKFAERISVDVFCAFKTVANCRSRRGGRGLRDVRLPFPASFRANGAGVFASLAWVGFGFSCQLWEDLGDWSRTHGLAISAFMSQGLFCSDGAGVCLAVLKGLQCGAVAVVLGLFLDAMGSCDREICLAAAAVFSAAASHRRSLHR